MIVYILEFDKQKIEFATLIEAENYALENSISEIPYEFEKLPIEVVELPIEVPQEIHRLKLFRGLGKLGITKDMIISGISIIESFNDLQKIDLIVKINEATTFSRNDEDLIAMAPMFGINDLDAFFINCNNIV